MTNATYVFEKEKISNCYNDPFVRYLNSHFGCSSRCFDGTHTVAADTRLNLDI